MLHCALRSLLHLHMAHHAPAYTKVILSHHSPGMKRRLTVERDGDQMKKKKVRRRMMIERYLALPGMSAAL